MRVYHGSNTEFNELKISKDLLKTTECNLVEGLGIYCMETEQLKGFFHYMYELEIITECTDFTKKSVAKKFVDNYNKTFKKLTKCSILAIYPELIQDIQTGYNTISSFEQIRNWIYNSPETCDLEDSIIEQLETEYLQNVPKVYKYYDKNYGDVVIIKDVKCAKIIQRIEKGE